MAEALALVASIAGVAGFATLAMQLGQGLVKLKELHKRLGDAPETLNHAILSIMTIQTQLQMVQTCTTSSGHYTLQRATVDAPLELCQRSIRKVNVIIDNIERGWKRSERFGKLMVTMKDREMRDLLQQLDREQSMLSLAVQFYAEATRKLDHNATLLAFQNVVDRLDRIEDAHCRPMINSVIPTTTQHFDVQPGSDGSSSTNLVKISGRRSGRPQNAKSKRFTLRLRFWSHTEVYSMSTSYAFRTWTVTLRTYNIVPVGSGILQACRNGDLAAVRAMIAAGRASPLDQDAYDNTTLMYATEQIAEHPDKCKALIQYLTTLVAFPNAHRIVPDALLCASALCGSRVELRSDVRSIAESVEAFEAILDSCDFDIDSAAAAPRESGFVAWALLANPVLACSVARRLTSPWTSICTPQERFEAAVCAYFAGKLSLDPCQMRRIRPWIGATLGPSQLLQICGVGAMNSQFAVMTSDGLSLLHIAADALADDHVKGYNSLWRPLAQDLIVLGADVHTQNNRELSPDCSDCGVGVGTPFVAYVRRLLGYRHDREYDWDHIRECISDWTAMLRDSGADLESCYQRERMYWPTNLTVQGPGEFNGDVNIAVRLEHGPGLEDWDIIIGAERMVPLFENVESTLPGHWDNFHPDLPQAICWLPEPIDGPEVVWTCTNPRSLRFRDVKLSELARRYTQQDSIDEIARRPERTYIKTEEDSIAILRQPRGEVGRRRSRSVPSLPRRPLAMDVLRRRREGMPVWCDSGNIVPARCLCKHDDSSSLGLQDGLRGRWCKQGTRRPIEDQEVPDWETFQRISAESGLSKIQRGFSKAGPVKAIQLRKHL
ncbi:hypothetical protein LTR15_008067 [Elasticomyces elasticus]|nr:hypothetical protein LTR15_008067 [Elasticomyces elasticus]